MSVSSDLSIKSQAQLLQDFGVVTFSFPLQYTSLNSNPGVFKKNLKGLPKEWQKKTLDEPLDVRVADSHNGLGLVTGRVSNTIAADIDNVPQFESYLNDIGQTMPETWTSRTGSGGVHYFYRWNDKFDQIKTSSKMITHKGKALDFDIRAENGFVICPPSKAMAGSELKSYEWIHAPGSVDLAEMPNWLFEVLTQKKATTTRKSPKNKVVASASSHVVVAKNDSIGEHLTEFILESFSLLPDKLNEFKYDAETDTFSIALKEKLCLFAKREHSNNHQYLLIKKNGMMVRKCHSKGLTCDGKEHKPTKVPDAILQELTHEYKTEPLDQELTKLALEEGQDHLMEVHGHEVELVRDNETKMLTGTVINWKCNKCCFMNVSARLGPDGSQTTCTNCGLIYPKKAFPIDFHKYAHLGKYMHVTFNIITNNNYITYNNEELEIGWNQFVDDNVPIVVESDLNLCLTKALSGSHGHLAALLHHIFGHKTVHCKDVRNPWFVFEQHRWLNDDSIVVHKQIKDPEFQMLLVKAKSAYKESKLNISNRDKKISQIQKVITSLENNSMQNSIVEQYQILCRKRHSDFLDKLDTSKFLVGFENGVYDLNRFEFRSGKPEDMVSMSVGYDYDESKMTDEETYKDFNDFFFKVFPNQDLADYVFKFLGSCLAGFTKDQLFHFGYGTGGNGKGVLLSALSHCLGAYAGKLESSFLTGKIPSANEATPALTNIVGKRFVAISEATKGSKLNEPLFKAMCGEDELVYRPMYGESRQFRPDFKFLMMCNDLPEFSAEDKAMIRRIRVIPFLASFKKEGDTLDPTKNEYLVDEDLMERTKGWKHVLMNVMIEGYRKYKKEGLKPPKAVLEATSKYTAANNIFEQARDELLLVKPDDGVEKDAYVLVLKSWISENYPGFKVPGRNELLESIDRSLMEGHILDKTTRRFMKQGTQLAGWKGFALANQEML